MFDRIEIHKQERILLWREKTYRIALGESPLGHKMREGDGKTPEGEYFVCTKNDKSKFHLSLGLSYPNASDAQAAFAAGRISKAECDAVCAAQKTGKRPPWDTALGGFIMIHGGGTDSDWTKGCIALSDADMDVLFAEVPLGTAVRILP